MSGHWIRFNKLLSDRRREVIVAVDHGEFLGPTEGIIDLPAAIHNAKEADGILLSPGMIAHCGGVFDQRGAPLAILRLNWGTVYCDQWGYEQGRSAPVITPQEALRLGADLCLCSLTFTTKDEEQDAKNVELFAHMASLKRDCGLPMIGEVFPCAVARLGADELHSQIKTACRIIVELGADAIKTFYTGERFGEVCEAVPVPVFALGAEKLPQELDALKLAQNAVKAGARGVVFGRNVIQAKDPAAFLDGLKRVVKDEAEPEEVALELGLR